MSLLSVVSPILTKALNSIKKNNGTTKQIRWFCWDPNTTSLPKPEGWSNDLHCNGCPCVVILEQEIDEKISEMKINISQADLSKLKSAPKEGIFRCLVIENNSATVEDFIK